MGSYQWEKYKREIADFADNCVPIFLPTEEYAHVIGEFNSNMSEEDRKSKIVIKAIGNYYYTIVNRGFGDYTVIAKHSIDGDVWADF